MEHLVGYAKNDLLVPLGLEQDPWADGLAGLNTRAVAWCEEVNTRAHSEICAVPAERLDTEVELLGELPSLRLQIGPRPITKKVDKLSCIRFGSARYSVPNRLIGSVVTVLVDERDRILRVVEPVTGEVHAEYELVAPGETSIVDAHYGRARPDTPRRAARPRTAAEREFLALGPVAEQFLVGAAAAGVSKLNTEIGQLLTVAAAHGNQALDPGYQRPRTPTHAGGAGAGDDPAHSAYQVAGRLPHRWG